MFNAKIKKVINNKEILTKVKHIIEKTISDNNLELVCVIPYGSRVFNYNTENSDYDFRVLVSHPMNKYISIDYTIKNIIYKEDNIDIEFIDIKNFLNLCSKSNPIVLDLLTIINEYGIKYDYKYSNILKIIPTFFLHNSNTLKAYKGIINNSIKRKNNYINNNKYSKLLKLLLKNYIAYKLISNGELPVLDLEKNHNRYKELFNDKTFDSLVNNGIYEYEYYLNKLDITEDIPETSDLKHIKDYYDNCFFAFVTYSITDIQAKRQLGLITDIQAKRQLGLGE